MPYTHTTWSQLQTQLSTRLGDASQRFWVADEVRLYLTESLRTFSLCSGFWRERGVLPTSTAIAFYDLPSLLLNGPDLLLAPTVTDRDILLQLQYALLESTASQATWSGTEMFTYDDLAHAIQHRLNQFLSDTGIVVNHAVINVNSPPGGRQVLAQSVIDVRRAGYIGSAPAAYFSLLWREDERLLTAADQGWSVDPATPTAYSIMGPPPLQLQLANLPIASGQLDLLTVDSLSLDPATSATLLGIPDDLSPAIKWGALADLLGIDGDASDPTRAQFCESRYRQYVMLARMLPVVLHAELNGVPLIPSTLAEMDAAESNWQNILSSNRAPIRDLLLAAPNLIALSAVPNSVSSVTLDVVRPAPIPISGGDPVQLGREQLDMLLDYAEHLALVKVSGAELQATARQASNFLLQSITYNQRLSASARSAFSASLQSQRQKHSSPRRLDSLDGQSVGVGAVKVSDQAGSG